VELAQVKPSNFDAMQGPQGVLLIGNPDEIVEKIIRHSKAIGGISRITFMMNTASSPHTKILKEIKLIVPRVAPALRKEID
jgi:hypothetical protein